jgi:hypothetical protein
VKRNDCNPRLHAAIPNSNDRVQFGVRGVAKPRGAGSARTTPKRSSASYFEPLAAVATG